MIEVKVFQDGEIVHHSTGDLVMTMCASVAEGNATMSSVLKGGASGDAVLQVLAYCCAKHIVDIFDDSDGYAACEAVAEFMHHVHCVAAKHLTERHGE